MSAKDKIFYDNANDILLYFYALENKLVYLTSTKNIDFKLEQNPTGPYTEATLQIPVEVMDQIAEAWLKERKKRSDYADHCDHPTSQYQSRNRQNSHHH
ncbi:MAG: hypothetical protein HQM12_18235 [SAR324 cluster bacterium]|nr:hypothetical protein [SAR324 cluster bacterium]